MAESRKDVYEGIPDEQVPETEALRRRVERLEQALLLGVQELGPGTQPGGEHRFKEIVLNALQDNGERR